MTDTSIKDYTVEFNKLYSTLVSEGYKPSLRQFKAIVMGRANTKVRSPFAGGPERVIESDHKALRDFISELELEKELKDRAASNKRKIAEKAIANALRKDSLPRPIMEAYNALPSDRESLFSINGYALSYEGELYLNE